MANTEILSTNKTLSGFVKVWKTHPTTGDTELLVDKQNMILKGGAKIIAHTLGGLATDKIWGMYIGYNNTASFNVTPPDPDYGNPFADFTNPFGYLREPLTFSPVFLSSTGYDENTVLFSTMITSASKASQQSADFGTNSRIYEVALIAAPQPSNPDNDIVFSRTTFNKIQYDSNFNFTITWGVRILLL